MKALVTYISWTGNTKKIAEAVFQGINTEKSIGTFDEVFDISSYDIVFVGFPIHGFGQPAAEAVRYLKERCSGKKVVIFITHAAPEDSSYVAPWLENCKEAAKETLFLGLFNCQGQDFPGEVRGDDAADRSGSSRNCPECRSILQRAAKRRDGWTEPKPLRQTS